jgi:hypothetical protein
MTALRNVLAVVVGAAVACLLGYIGAVIVLLSTVGIPLGSPGRDPTPREYAVYLVVSSIGSAIGGRTAARLAPRASRRRIGLAVAAGLALLMLWGFSGEGVQWPAWWAPALALSMGGGALVATVRRDK